MDDYEYRHCPKRTSIPCYRDQPLLSVISKWFEENHDIAIDFNPVAVIQFCFMCMVAWFFIKMSFRMIKSMLKPFLFISALLIVLYTKQFSKSVDGVDFVLNVFINAIELTMKVLDTVILAVFGERVFV